MKPSRYSLPPLEWKGHSYKWRLTAFNYPLPRPVRYILFSQSQAGDWWFKVCREDGPYLPRIATRAPSVSVWTPVPGFGFELPKEARLLKETAVLPNLTPKEWADSRDWSGLPLGHRVRQEAA